MRASGFLEEGDLVGCNGSPTRTTTDSKMSAVVELRYKAKALEEAASSFSGEVANSWIELDGYFSRCENGTRFPDVSEKSVGGEAILARSPHVKI
jgi:hypothetical protein